MPSSNAWRDSGDVALVSSVLSGAALCLGCIVRKTGVPAPRVHAVVAIVGRMVETKSRHAVYPFGIPG